MGKPVDIKKYRVARLADGIEATLRQNGANGFVVETASVDDPGLWRRAAVLATHRLGYRASTVVAADRIALMVHRPVTEVEQRLAVEAVSALLRPGPRLHR